MHGESHQHRSMVLAINVLLTDFWAKGYSANVNKKDRQKKKKIDPILVRQRQAATPCTCKGQVWMVYLDGSVCESANKIFAFVNTSWWKLGVLCETWHRRCSAVWRHWQAYLQRVFWNGDDHHIEVYGTTERKPMASTLNIQISSHFWIKLSF